MEDNEDEPEDVRKATPVEEEIRKGEIDQDSGRPTQSRETARKHRCEKQVDKKKPKEKSEEECCRARRAKAAKAPKTATVFIHEKICTLPKIKAIPRHCLTKQEWIDILATPSRKCPSSCLKKPVVRRIRPVSPRMAELAQPPKQRLINTLQSRAGILPIELIDKLIQNLEGETCLTPEQAEELFRDKEDRSRKKSRKKKSKVKCPSDKYGNPETGVASGSSDLDRDAVNCQYSMAESFVRSILEWKCPIPREEFKDIADVILKRLALVLEYGPINGEDKRSQQMRFLADVIGSWITGVLFEVAEARRTELDEECERRRRAKDEESEEDSEEDSPGRDTDDEDDERKRRGGGGGPGAGGGGGAGGRGSTFGRWSRKKKDSKDDDKDEGKKERKKSGASFGRGSVDKTKEHDEKQRERRSTESRETEEKKTPTTRREKAPEEAAKRESGDAKAEGKRKDDEGRGKSEKESATTPTIDSEAGEPADSTLGDSTMEKRPDETPKRTDEDRDAGRESARVDGGVEEHPDDSKLPDDAKKIVERGGTATKDGPVTADNTSDSLALAGLKEAVGNEDETPKIHATDAPRENAEVARYDPSVEREEEKQPRKTTIDEEETERPVRDAEKMSVSSVRAATAAEIPRAQPRATFDPSGERQGDETTPTIVDDETRRTGLAAKVSQEQPEVTFDPRAESEADERMGKTTIDDRVPKLEPEMAFGGGAGTEREEIPVEGVAEGQTEMIDVESPRRPDAVSEVPRDETGMTTVSRKKPEAEAADGEVETRKMRETDSAIGAKGEKQAWKDAKMPMLAEEKKMSEEDEERRRITEAPGESSRSPEFGKTERRKLAECPSGLTMIKKYRNDTPFVTFDRIFHTIYNAIEESEENNGSDAMTNRLHRVVYEKFSNIVQEEKRDPLTELTKDVLEVMSGKIAMWLRNVLTESQMNFANKFPATIESTEIREWTKWINCVTDIADDWSKWIRNTIKEAEGLRARRVTRGDWADWRENIDIDALQWRRFYLESVHRAHQNLTIVRDRRVVKTGAREFPDYREDKDDNEREVRITDLQAENS